jgi:hypothetical protein
MDIGIKEIVFFIAIAAMIALSLLGIIESYKE